ncbi:MAG TPA: hypothetical protein VGO67_11735 [Verrucomicrobiae bacterium]
MLRRFAKYILLLVLTCSIGLHWTLLQSVAWTGMIIDYTYTSSLTEALAKTFDGKHPCPLCKQIAAGKQTEKKKEFPLHLQKFEFASEHSEVVFTPPQFFCLQPAVIFSISELTHQPPAPPPRVV